MCETLCLSKFNLFFRLILFFKLILFLLRTSELSRGSKRIRRRLEEGGGGYILLFL